MNKQGQTQKNRIGFISFQISLCIDSVKHIQIHVNYGSTPPLPFITKLREFVTECNGERYMDRFHVSLDWEESQDESPAAKRRRKFLVHVHVHVCTHVIRHHIEGAIRTTRMQQPAPIQTLQMFLEVLKELGLWRDSRYTSDTTSKWFTQLQGNGHLEVKRDICA